MPRRDPRLGWIPDHPDIRDLRYSQVFKVVTDVPSKVDLRDQFSVPVYDQGNLGSCTANAIGAAIQYLNLSEGRPDPVPSRLFIYYNEREMEDSVDYDAGANIRDGIKSVVKQGTCIEPEWPYDISKFSLKPPASAYVDALKDLVGAYYSVDNRDVDAMIHCIAAGFPFVFGISVYSSFIDAPHGDIPMPTVFEQLQGGHALLAVGYNQDTKRFILRNSWGPGWGDNGYGTIPFDYLSNGELGSDYWTLRATPPPMIAAAKTSIPSKAPKIAGAIQAPTAKEVK